MGEKELASGQAASEQAGAAKSVQWEPHKAPGLDTPEQQVAEQKTRHDASQAAIQNTR
jgi:hypothetical protein